MKHLAVALGVMKKNRMAKGGRPSNVEPSLMKKSINSDPKALAALIARKKMGDKDMMADGGEVLCAHGGPMKCAYGCYAEGGEAGNESMPLDHDENDFLSDAEDDQMNSSAPDFLSEDESEEDPKMKRRGILKKILEA